MQTYNIFFIFNKLLLKRMDLIEQVFLIYIYNTLITITFKDKIFKKVLYILRLFTYIYILLLIF